MKGYSFLKLDYNLEIPDDKEKSKKNLSELMDAARNICLLMKQEFGLLKGDKE